MLSKTLPQRRQVKRDISFQQFGSRRACSLVEQPPLAVIG
jgi:hypothetical protein